MTFNVRVSAYSGVVTAPLSQVRQQSSDSILLVRQPRLSEQVIASNGVTPVRSNPAPKGTKLLRVEVADGNAIRYQLVTGGNAADATAASDGISGTTMIDCPEGAMLSFIDAAGT